MTVGLHVNYMTSSGNVVDAFIVGSKCDIFFDYFVSSCFFFRYASVVYSCSYFSLFHLFISIFCTFLFFYVAFCSFSHNLSSYINM